MSGGELPDPIPNSVVKASSADGTWPLGQGEQVIAGTFLSLTENCNLSVSEGSTFLPFKNASPLHAGVHFCFQLNSSEKFRMGLLDVGADFLPGLLDRFVKFGFGLLNYGIHGFGNFLFGFLGHVLGDRLN